MAMVEEMKRKGSSAWKIRFYRNGRHQSLSLNSKYTREDAEEIAAVIERWVQSEYRGMPLDRLTAAFFESASSDLRKRFAAIGVLEARSAYTIEDAWTEFLDERRYDLAVGTVRSWKVLGQRLSNLFNVKRLVADVTERDAFECRRRLSEVYLESTVAFTIARFQTFWKWCVKRGITTKNVFDDVRKGTTVNRSKDFQIPREWTNRILRACPTQEWRTLFVLWRIAGLRKREPLEITWDCVDFKAKRIVVPSPKTKRFDGKDRRVVPLFPALERELKASRKETPQDQRYVVWRRRPHNFEPKFRRILAKAGIEPWAKIFQNMRASAENDLVEDGFPEHVVGAWIGHTANVQRRHYLRVLDSYFDRATSKKPSPAKGKKVGHEIGHESM